MELIKIMKQQKSKDNYYIFGPNNYNSSQQTSVKDQIVNLFTFAGFIINVAMT